MSVWERIEENRRRLDVTSGDQVELRLLREYACLVEADLAAAREALADAIECVESWGAYADGYFRHKHDLDGDLARLRAALPAPPKED